MNVKKPDWLDIELIRKMKGEIEDHPSWQNYIRDAKIQQRFYRGSPEGLRCLLFPDEEFGDDPDMPEEQLTARYNKIKENIDKTGSIFLKNNPVVRRWPYTRGEATESDAMLADAMDAMWLDAWKHSDGQQELRNMLQEAQVTGLSIGKVIWNPLDRSRGRNGEILFVKPACGSVRFDPFCSNAHRGKDARYIIHPTMQKPGYLVRKFGRPAEVALGLRKGPGRSKKFSFSTMLQTTATFVKKKIVSDGTERVDDRVQADEVWIFPKTYMEADLIGGTEIKPDEYPHGLVATVINDEIVQVIANPFVKKRRRMDEFGLPTRETVQIGHARHPFVPLYWARTSDVGGKGRYSFYDCMSQAESMISLQVAIDRIRRNIHMNARTIANPVLTVQEDSLEQAVPDLLWTPGQILTIKNNFRPEDAVQILQGATMPQYVYDMLMTDIAAIEKSAGIEPGVVGLFPTGGGTSHTPGVTIGALQESAFGPLWVYVTELAVALLDLSVLYDGLMQLKYKPEKYTTFSEGRNQQVVDWTERHITANFHRRVVAGATTPLFDIDRQQYVGGVVEIVKEAIATQHPRIIETAIAHIDALNYPWAEQFKQILEEERELLLQMQQGYMETGAAALSQGQQQGIDPNIMALAERIGRRPEDVAAALG